MAIPKKKAAPVKALSRVLTTGDLSNLWVLWFDMQGKADNGVASITYSSPRPAVVDFVEASGCAAGLLEVKSSLYPPTGSPPYGFQMVEHVGTPMEAFALASSRLRFEQGRIPRTSVVIPWLKGASGKPSLTVTITPDSPPNTAAIYQVYLIGRFNP